MPTHILALLAGALIGGINLPQACEKTLDELAAWLEGVPASLPDDVRQMAEAIVDEIAPKPGDVMVEIGPGLAALTQPLVERLGRLTVIELDRDLAKRLREMGAW